MKWPRATTVTVLTNLLLVHLSCESYSELQYCGNGPDGVHGDVRGEDAELKADCKNSVLSWGPSSYKVQYYGLLASCTNRSFIPIYNHDIGASNFISQEIPLEALPDTNEVCHYYGCMFNYTPLRVNFFINATCYGASFLVKTSSAASTLLLQSSLQNTIMATPTTSLLAPELSSQALHSPSYVVLQQSSLVSESPELLESSIYTTQTLSNGLEGQSSIFTMQTRSNGSPVPSPVKLVEDSADNVAKHTQVLLTSVKDNGEFNAIIVVMTALTVFAGLVCPVILLLALVSRYNNYIKKREADFQRHEINNYLSSLKDVDESLYEYMYSSAPTNLPRSLSDQSVRTHLEPLELCPITHEETQKSLERCLTPNDLISEIVTEGTVQEIRLHTPMAKVNSYRNTFDGGGYVNENGAIEKLKVHECSGSEPRLSALMSELSESTDLNCEQCFCEEEKELDRSTFTDDSGSYFCAEDVERVSLSGSSISSSSDSHETETNSALEPKPKETERKDSGFCSLQNKAEYYDMKTVVT